MGNLKAEIELVWADGTHLFALKAVQIRELENICKEGIGRICMRVFSGIDYTYAMLRETIRLGLIGGGMAPVNAKTLVDMYVDNQPIDAVGDPASTLKTATAVLKAVHFGWEDLPGAPPGESVATGSQTSESSPPHS